MANNDRVKNLESCLDEVTSDLEVLAITGFPESGGWSKISKHCATSRRLLAEGRKMDRKDTTISVDIKTAERLRELAKEDDRTVSSMVRRILQAYEENHWEKVEC
tara:strand:+ start:520 stop:834 length:315 start_codon:yes stop_codon:yes gene_type:complete